MTERCHCGEVAVVRAQADGEVKHWCPDHSPITTGATAPLGILDSDTDDQDDVELTECCPVCDIPKFCRRESSRQTYRCRNGHEFDWPNERPLRRLHPEEPSTEGWHELSTRTELVWTCTVQYQRGETARADGGVLPARLAYLMSMKERSVRKICNELVREGVLTRLDGINPQTRSALKTYVPSYLVDDESESEYDFPTPSHADD